MTANAQVSPPLEIVILDVGHGNSAIIRDGRVCAVVDAAPGTVTADELEAIGCNRIEHLVLSHSDNDHIGSAARLLLDDSREIGTLWFNSDAEKNTRIWDRVLRAAHTRKMRGGFDGHQNASTANNSFPAFGRAQLQIVSPSIIFAGKGPSPKRTEFGRLTANSLSVVLKVLLDGEATALLTGDMDGIALNHCLENNHDLKAPVLVFPHHGGLPGSDPEGPRAFAEKITRQVQPELVIFSIKGGRNPANPNPDIVAGVRDAAPNAHIACTQLSIHCHPDRQRVSIEHLSDRSAAGLETGRCCAGTITVRKAGHGLVFEPELASHKAFTETLPLIPICKQMPDQPRVGKQKDRSQSADDAVEPNIM